MLSKEQADTIAQGLLASEPRVQAPRVPALFRTREGARLGRDLEWQLFRQANASTMSGSRRKIAFVAYPVLVMLLWFAFASHPVSEWYVMAGMFALVIPFYMRIFLVRRELARLVAAASEPVSHS